MQGVADPAPEDRSESESDEVPAKLRKCGGKRSEEWKFLEDIGGTRELGGSASGFDGLGFEEILDLHLQRARCEAHARDPDAHLSVVKSHFNRACRFVLEQLSISCEVSFQSGAESHNEYWTWQL